MGLVLTVSQADFCLCNLEAALPLRTLLQPSVARSTPAWLVFHGELGARSDPEAW